GNSLGAADTTAPYSMTWNTTTGSNGSHVLTAVAQDTGGNSTTSATVTVTVSNSAPGGSVLSLGMNEGTGTTTADVSGNGNTGTLSGATWITTGKYGNALSFNGTSANVGLGNPTSLQLTGSMTVSA